MSKQPKYKLIDEESLNELIRNGYRQGYAVMLLSYICQRYQLVTELTKAEACGVLGLSPRQLDEAFRLCQIRTTGYGANRFYSAFDLANLAAELHRRKLIGNLKQMPSFVTIPKEE